MKNTDTINHEDAHTLFTQISIALGFTMFYLFITGRSTVKEKTEKMVYIIRGVPGSGKKHLVYHMERGETDTYSLCDKNDYFVSEGGEFKFEGKNIARAENYSKMRFLNSVHSGISRIYVIGYFNELWMYDEYKKLAEMHNYNVTVIEITCPDVDHLRHFNRRNIYKPPFSKSKRSFNNWETDTDSYIQEAYLDNLPGDVIPTYGIINKAITDRFDTYMGSNEKITVEQSMSESGSENDTAIDDAGSAALEGWPRESDTLIGYISDSEIEIVLRRNLYMNE